MAACKGYLTHGCVKIATVGLWDSVIPRMQRLLFFEFLHCQILQISGGKASMYLWLFTYVHTCLCVLKSCFPGTSPRSRTSWHGQALHCGKAVLGHRYPRSQKFVSPFFLFCTHQGYLGLPAVLVRDAQGSWTRQCSSVSVLTHGLLYVCSVIE